MNEESLFMAALEMSDLVEREAFLAEQCGTDAEMRRRVQALLQAYQIGENQLEPVSHDVGVTGDYVPNSEDMDQTGILPSREHRSNLQAGFEIADRYTLMEKIGEGGMGEVWVARQSQPVKRNVAIKLIKSGMDSKAVVARFEQERQALAMMDHPNIARVLDGGITPMGHPYFVMELVNGLTLTKYCDEATLTPNERMELFVPICQAVQHAHQKGIVHRDLKPANILVTMIDGKPVPKVIDFGVAKATAGSLTDVSVFTQFGAVVGTLEYMAPEQAGFSGQDVDTRADIYSLGVILYELLTGLRPIDASRLKNAALTEMIRIIREEEPTKPSTRLSTERLLPTMAASRKMDPKKLTSLLRGELDWVVLKCLEKQRDRRYETADALCRDIQRFLSDEPVEARPPSTAYRIEKFLKRNKGPVLAASIVLLALVGGIIGTTLGLYEAKRQEKLAEDRLHDAETAQRAEAERAAGEKKARMEEQRERQRAVKAESKIRNQADELKHRLGISYMILANTTLDQFNEKLASEWLTKVPPEQHNWAWRYLKKQTQGGLFTVCGHSSPVTCVAFSPDGKKFVTAGGFSRNYGGGRQPAEVIVWDARTGEVLLELKDLPFAAGSNFPSMSVAFSPDGRKIVLSRGKQAGLAKVWDAETGKILLELKDVKEPVHCVAFSPDGKKIATASPDASVSLWDAITGVFEKKLESVENSTEAETLVSLAFSPDGKLIASRGGDFGNVWVWDLSQEGKLILDTKHSVPGQSSVAFSPDSKRLVVGNSRNAIIVLDPRSGRILLQTKREIRHSFTIFSILYGTVCASFSPDGKRIVTGGGGQFYPGSGDITVWDAITGERLHEFRGHNQVVTTVAFSPDGEQILSGSMDQTVKIWDARTRSGRLELQGHGREVVSIAVNSDGSKILSGAGNLANYGTASGEATLWNTLTGKADFEMKGFPASVNCVVFSPDGKRMVTAGLGPEVELDPRKDPKLASMGGAVKKHTGLVKVWDAKTGAFLFKLEGVTHGVNCITYNADGTRFLTVGFSDSMDLTPRKGTELKIWDAQTGKLVHDLTEQKEVGYAIPMGHRGGVAAFSPDGRWVIASGIRRVTEENRKMMFRWAGAISVWNAQSGQYMRDIQSIMGAPANSLQFSRDGKWVLVGSSDKTSKVFNFETGELLFELKGHQDAVNSAAFNPDGRLIVTGSADGTIRVWDTKTATSLAVLRGHAKTVSSVTFSPDGKNIISGGGEIGKPGEVFVWNTHLDPISVDTTFFPIHSFSPDERRFIVKHNDVKICDAATGKTICTLRSTGGSDYLFSPDGKKVVSASVRYLTKENRNEGQVLVWNADTGKELLNISDVGNVKLAAFSLDGTRIVTTTQDNDVSKTRVWDATTGKELANQTTPQTLPLKSRNGDGCNLLAVNGDIFQPIQRKFPPEEITYRRLHTQPRWERYRQNYLAARLAKTTSSEEIAQNEFAANFYLNLLPAEERAEMVAKGDAAVAKRR